MAMHKSLRLHHIYLVSQHVQMQWNHWVYCVFFRLLRPQHLGSNRSRCLANIPTSQSSAWNSESSMKEKHLAALIRRNHDFFDSPKYPLNAGKHNASFFLALVLQRWRGPLPCCLCSRQCCTSKRHLSCKMQKEFSFEKCSQCSFFTFIKTGAFFIFSHNMTMNVWMMVFSHILIYFDIYISHIVMCCHAFL